MQKSFEFVISNEFLVLHLQREPLKGTFFTLPTFASKVVNPVLC